VKWNARSNAQEADAVMSQRESYQAEALTGYLVGRHQGFVLADLGVHVLIKPFIECGDVRHKIPDDVITLMSESEPDRDVITRY
jgi:hypothetical protein